MVTFEAIGTKTQQFWDRKLAKAQKIGFCGHFKY